MAKEAMRDIISDKDALIRHIIRMLHERVDTKKIFFGNELNRQTSAGVILLLGSGANPNERPGEPCLIVNKRSREVRQPGDLCFPGGSITPRLDWCLAKLVSLPLTSLSRWQYWKKWKRNDPQAAKHLALIWATGLRESLEEMRLNPFGAKFLGPLPPQNLVMFQRKIFPIAAWIQHQKRFFPNWEVDKILYIPLRKLLNPSNYRRYRLRMKFPKDREPSNPRRDFPCFRYQHSGDIEILWGATFRITTTFMENVFGFRPPQLETLPVIEGRLSANYLTGH